RERDRLGPQLRHHSAARGLRRLCRADAGAAAVQGRQGGRQRPHRGEEEMSSPKNLVCLWYDGGAEEAANFYAATFPDTRVEFVQRAPGDYPDGKQGDVLVARSTIMGIPVIHLNGGPEFPPSESFSFQVTTEDQEETDRYWNAIVGNGGNES